MRVLKFGGTSVADAAAIERLAAIVRRERDNDPRPGTVVVVSALGGVTDALLGLGEQSRTGLADQALVALEALRTRHAQRWQPRSRQAKCSPSSRRGSTISSIISGRR